MMQPAHEKKAPPSALTFFRPDFLRRQRTWRKWTKCWTESSFEPPTAPNFPWWRLPRYSCFFFFFFGFTKCLLLFKISLIHFARDRRPFIARGLCKRFYIGVRRRNVKKKQNSWVPHSATCDVLRNSIKRCIFFSSSLYISSLLSPFARRIHWTFHISEMWGEVVIHRRMIDKVFGGLRPSHFEINIALYDCTVIQIFLKSEHK